MKGIATILFCIFLTLMISCDSGNDPKTQNSIEIIPLPEGYDLLSSAQQPELKMLFNQDDIISYEWNTHTIHLTQNSLDRIKSDQRELLQKGFILKVNDEIIYTGTFWSYIFSSICSGPVINVMQDINGKYSFLNDVVKIENGYHSEETSWDPRSDQRLYKALLENNQLTNKTP